MNKHQQIQSFIDTNHISNWKEIYDNPHQQNSNYKIYNDAEIT